ncbi:putative ribonuclease H-like domain-containing protein [Tanacetum coccineum]
MQTTIISGVPVLNHWMSSGPVIPHRVRLAEEQILRLEVSHAGDIMGCLVLFMVREELVEVVLVVRYGTGARIVDFKQINKLLLLLVMAGHDEASKALLILGGVVIQSESNRMCHFKRCVVGLNISEEITQRLMSSEPSGDVYGAMYMRWSYLKRVIEERTASMVEHEVLGCGYRRAGGAVMDRSAFDLKRTMQEWATEREAKQCSAVEREKVLVRDCMTEDTLCIVQSVVEEGVMWVVELVDEQYKCDHGTEFKNHLMNEFCAKKGIKREYSIARTPQQNGVAERKNRTLIEKCKTIKQTSVTYQFGLKQSILLVMCLTRVLELGSCEEERTKLTMQVGAIEYQSLIDLNVDIESIYRMRPAGDCGKMKLGSAYLICSVRHCGFGVGDLGWRRWSMKQALRIIVCLVMRRVWIGGEGCKNTGMARNSDDDVPKDGVFSTNSFDDENTDNEEDGVPDYNNMDHTIDVTTTPTLRIHKNHPQSQIIGKSAAGVLTRRKLKESASDQHQALLIQKVSQALADESWVEAMQEELLQFKLQDVWVLCDLPDGKRVIGTKWVFRNKRDERGTIIKNKARLVAQGIEAINTVLAFASFMGFTVYQMDVKSAFLYGNITEEVYVKQPPGFEDPAHPNKVYRVVKALYGLHQAPRAWYERLSTFLLKHRYRRGAIDKTLFIKKDRRDIMLVQVYVDDIIFGSTKSSMVKDFEDLMQKEFKMSSMGELTFFLGLQVKQTTAGIFLSQDKYVKDILNKFDFRTIKPASTPIEAHKSLGKDEEGEDVDVHLYRSMIGCLMYLTASRPDIMFAVCLCARFQVTPKVSHMHAVKRIFSRSTSVDVNILGEDWFSCNARNKQLWLSHLQKAEYVACYNESTICIVKNPVLHSKTKHIQIRHHFIRDCYEQRLINVVKVHTDDNVADLLTKGFDLARFNFLVVTIVRKNLWKHYCYAYGEVMNDCSRFS